MITTFVLTLYCLTCQPLQVVEIHDIPVFDNPSATWADLTCRRWGDELSGDYRRRNFSDGTAAGQIAAEHFWIMYSCTPESAAF